MLLVSQASLDDLNERLREKQGAEVERFRPNLVVQGALPYAEDAWQSLEIGGLGLRVAGPCTRCEVVCANPADGIRRGPEPLLTLASYRRARGRINFGILLEMDLQSGCAADPVFSVGAPVSVQ